MILNIVSTKLLDHCISAMTPYINLSTSAIYRIIESDVKKIKDYSNHRNRRANDYTYLVFQLLNTWSQMDIFRVNNIQLNVIMKECDLSNYAMFRFMLLKHLLTGKNTVSDTLGYLNSKCPSLSVIFDTILNLDCLVLMILVVI